LTDDARKEGPRQRGPSPLPPSLLPNEVAAEPAVDLRVLPWTHVEADEGGQRLRVHATLDGGPPCTVLGRVDLREADDAVEVTLWVGRRPDARCDGPQPALALPIVVPVGLSAPLGSRVLRDGAR
jgi:hypothetical protein